MSAGISVAVGAGAGGMIGWGSADFFAKKTIDRLDDLTPLFWNQLVGTGLLVIIALVSGDGLHVSVGDCFTITAFGVGSGLSYLLLYRGFAAGQVSLLSPIF